VYRWQGEIEQASENLLIIKTRALLLDELTATVKRLHEYSVPEIIALPVIGGNADYLDWIEESLK
jgi:periplasmic divalent cation tolerance protein